MGNPEAQLLSVQDSWIDVPLAIDVSDGTLLKSICGYKRLRLTRGNIYCKTICGVYASCSTIGFKFELLLDYMLRHARETSPSRGFADVNLVLSHRRRLAIKGIVQHIMCNEQKPTEVFITPATRKPER